MALNILLVEAYDAVFDALDSWFRAVVPRCEVTRATGAEEALEIARAEGPNLIVIRDDSVGAGLAEAIENLKLRAPEAPVVVLTDDERPRRRDEVMAAGASAYVSTWRVKSELQEFLEDLAAADGAVEGLL